MFLYLLNMSKANMFKIGIASSIDRIKQHLNTYHGLINLKESYIINAKDDSTIKMLEKQLLEDYKEYTITDYRYNGLNGSTELRSIEVLNNVLEDIKYKVSKLPNKIMRIEKDITKIITKDIQNDIEDKKSDVEIQKFHAQNLLQIEKVVKYIQYYRNNVVDIIKQNETITRIIIKFNNTKVEYKPIPIVSVDLPKRSCTLVNYATNHYANNTSLMCIYVYANIDLETDTMIKEYKELFHNKLLAILK